MKRILRVVLVASAGASLLALALLLVPSAGAISRGLSAIPGTDGTLHLCYNGVGNVRVVDAPAQECLAGETGVTALSSVPAPPAPQYVTSTVRYTASNVGSQVTVQLACPSGTHAVGGGVDHVTQSPASGYHVIQLGSATELPASESSADGTQNLGLPRPVDSGTSWRMSVSVGNAVEEQDYVGQEQIPVTVTFYVTCV